MSTRSVRKEDVERKWWLVDASDQTVGRLATQIARVLRGKHKPQFTPNADVGDFVVLINADKVQFSGKKWDAKEYFSHSRFFGSLKRITAETKHAKDPTHAIEEAVKGMLPRNKLSRRLIQKLKAYSGAEHPHDAQKPELLKF